MSGRAPRHSGVFSARGVGTRHPMVIRRLVMPVMIAVALAAGGCGGGDEEATTEEPATQETPAATATATEEGAEQASAGRDIFVRTCGGCHTLGDAGTSGQVGPSLDEVAPSEEQVLSAIESGPGQMPENLLQGEEAQQVADYVASAAGG